jgi:hypothetical protein
MEYPLELAAWRQAGRSASSIPHLANLADTKANK